MTNITEISQVEDQSKKESNTNGKLLKQKSIKIQIKKQKSIKIQNKN